MNWREEIKSAIKTNNFPLVESEYPTFIPEDYLSFIQKKDSEALKKQFLPHIDEVTIQDGFIDPIGDQKNLKKPGIIHRYKNRILFTPTSKCPINCRYCFRKNELNNKTTIFNSSLQELENYLNAHPEVNEVILTGGDPLFISNKKVQLIFDSINKFETVSFIRFHTRFPIIVPKRIDDDLLTILKTQNQKKKIVIAIHSNHLDEFNEQNELAIKKLTKVNLKLISQTVLLKGVNNSVRELSELFHKFTALEISPYYLHHPDYVKGALHFYLSFEEGYAIYEKLRNILPGWMIPHYITDNFLGKGKKLVAQSLNEQKPLKH